jgi:predicted nucleic acid-binding protein
LRAGWSERIVEAASLPLPAGSASGTIPGQALDSASGAVQVSDVLAVAGKVVLDASVILRWLLRGEDDADRALALRERIVAGAVQAFVPPHAPLEIADALRSAAEHGRVSQMAVLPLLRAVEALRLEVADPWGYAADSLAVARELGIGVADAAGIVAARRSGATLVTANRSLLDAASTSGDSVAWLGEVKA